MLNRLPGPKVKSGWILSDPPGPGRAGAIPVATARENISITRK